MDEGCGKLASRDARRQAILDIAWEIFLTGGYASASMSAIAARLGGSKGTLYNYFCSKEELFGAVIRDHCDGVQAALFDGLRPGGGDVATTLRALGERYAEIILSDETIMLNRVVIAEAVRFPELGRSLYEAGPKRGVARLAAYLEQEMQCGRLHRADAGVAAQMLTELSLGGLYRLRLLNLRPQPPPAEIQANVDSALKIFLIVYGVDGRAAGVGAVDRSPV